MQLFSAMVNRAKNPNNSLTQQRHLVISRYDVGMPCISSTWLARNDRAVGTCLSLALAGSDEGKSEFHIKHST